MLIAGYLQKGTIRGGMCLPISMVRTNSPLTLVKGTSGRWFIWRIWMPSFYSSVQRACSKASIVRYRSTSLQMVQKPKWLKIPCWVKEWFILPMKTINVQALIKNQISIVLNTTRIKAAWYYLENDLMLLMFLDWLFLKVCFDWLIQRISKCLLLWIIFELRHQTATNLLPQK